MLRIIIEPEVELIATSAKKDEQYDERVACEDIMLKIATHIKWPIKNMHIENSDDYCRLSRSKINA